MAAAAETSRMTADFAKDRRVVGFGGVLGH